MTTAHFHPAARPLGSSMKCGAVDAFSAGLQHLQGVHDEQVATLTRENARLREEVDTLRQPPEATSHEPQLPLRVGHAGHGATVEADFEEQSAREASKNTAGSLSAGVSRRIQDHLTQFKSERSAMVWMPSIQSVGSSLLDEYSLYRERTEERGARGCMRRLVSSPKFDTSTGAVTLANAVTIGLDASITRAGHSVPLALHVSECVFLTVYTAEICMRLGAFGRRALRNAWVLFDVVLVCCGCFDMVTNFLGHSVALLNNLLLVRIFRLARLARVLRLMIRFHTFWMLVHGLLNSLVTLAWTCVIISILLFIFAVLGLELLQPDATASEEYNRVASENFGSLLKAAMSLLQGMTLDSFAAIYRPVMLEKPLTIFYFVPFLLVVSIALMNLVTALMVNSSLEQAAQDKHAEEQAQTQHKAEVIRILERAFAELDTDQSGHIGLQEMLEAPEELRTLMGQVADVDTDNEDKIVEIFRALDFDNTGQVEIEDFCQGLLMLHDQKALESFHVMKHCSRVLKMLKFRQKRAGEESGVAMNGWSEQEEAEEEREAHDNGEGRGLSTAVENKGVVHAEETLMGL